MVAMWKMATCGKRYNYRKHCRLKHTYVELCGGSMWRMYVDVCAWAVVWVCMRSREYMDAILQFLFDFNLTLGYTYGVRVDKE